MVIVFCYKGDEDKSTLRERVLTRYNVLINSPTYVRLYYDNGVPYLTEGRHVSITHTDVGEGDRIELIAIGDEPLGIDVESMDRVVNMDIARRYFSPSEREYIDGDMVRLIEIWQKHEALGKADKSGMYREDVMHISHFHMYELYQGYRVVLYTKESEIAFVAL